jgi:hypothetical protein
MPAPVLVSFIGGDEGEWRVTEVRTVKGEPLPVTSSVNVVESSPREPAPMNPGPEGWVLRGVVSNLRYTTREEVKSMAEAGNPPLARPRATRAAMIPITKSDEWWAMTQEERCALIAESQHITVGKEYLPAVSRRLHHGRDLGEPFDFVTWSVVLNATRIGALPPPWSVC